MGCGGSTPGPPEKTTHVVVYGDIFLPEVRSVLAILKIGQVTHQH